MLKSMLKEDYIFVDVEITNGKKEEAINKISEICSTKCMIATKKLVKAFMAREKLDSTGFGEKIAIPHAKIKGLKSPMVAIFKFAQGVEWNSIDGIPVEIAIVLIMPEKDKENLHLQVLAQLSRKLMHEEFVNKIFEIDQSDVLYQYIISEMEEN